MNNPDINPSCDENHAMIFSGLGGFVATDKYSSYNFSEIALLIWKDKRVKYTLMNDNLELYNELIKFEIQNKIKHF